MARVAAFAGRIVTFGDRRGADVRATDVEDRGLDGTRRASTTPAGQRAIEMPLPGRGNLLNVLAATAVALEFGVPLDDDRRRAPRR